MATWGEIHADALNELAVLAVGEDVDPIAQTRDLRVCRQIVQNMVYLGFGVAGYQRWQRTIGPQELYLKWRLSPTVDETSGTGEPSEWSNPERGFGNWRVPQAPASIRSLRLFGASYSEDGYELDQRDLATFFGIGSPLGGNVGELDPEDGTGDPSHFYYEKQTGRDGVIYLNRYPGQGTRMVVTFYAPDMLAALPPVLDGGAETALPDHERYITLRLAHELAPSYSATDMLGVLRANMRDARRALTAANAARHVTEQVDLEYRQPTIMLRQGGFRSFRGSFRR